jgi:UDPglucose 6-dehydrogenase
LLGLAFKPGTDDLRDSPALEVAERLLSRGAEVIAYDPLVSSVSQVPGLAVVGDPYEVATDADAVVLATDWPDFLLLDLAKLRARMRGNVFLDGRNVFDHYMMDAAGLHYEPVGRPKASTAIELDWVPEIRQHAAPANGRHLDALTRQRPWLKTRALAARSDVDGT